MRLLVVLLVIFTIPSFCLAQTTWYVPDDFPKIQDAISDSSVVDGDTVIVRPGTYVENLDFLGKTITLKSELGPDVTVVDGNSGGSVVTFRHDEGVETIIDGFTLTNGKTSSAGGGIYCNYNTSPCIINNIISGNSVINNGNGSGGGICCGGSSTIENNTISGNLINVTYNGSGGGICCEDSSIVKNNIVSGNSINVDSRGQGGGICCGDSSTVENNIILGNSVNTNGYDKTSSGGGIYCSGTSIIKNNTISKNSASGASGSSKANGGGIFISGDSGTKTVTNNTITENSAKNGGGFYCYYISSSNISSNLISKNSASYGGGGYCYNNSSSTLINNLIFENASSKGGGVYVESSHTKLINNTLVRNRANNSGGSIYNEGSSSSIEIHNSILWGNKAPSNPEIDSNQYADVEITYSDIKGGYPGTGNIDANPFFMDPSKGDYHLTSISPCIDVGNNSAPHLPSEDFEGDDRIIDNIVDMGADEFTGPPHIPRTRHVPGEYSTIQDALDSALPLDTILVAAGTYYENINMLGKIIKLKSINGPTRTFIEGNGTASVLQCINGEVSETLIDGFTLKNGYADNGGGIYCEYSSPTIRNNSIIKNSSLNNGGGIYCCSLSDPSITDNIIRDNYSYDCGGGIYSYTSSTPIIFKNIISNNEAVNSGGGIYCRDSSPIITGNEIIGNLAGWEYGGGLYCRESSPVLMDNVIAFNAGDSGGGISCFNQSFPIITNNIINENAAHWDGAGGGIYCDDSSPILTNNTLVNNMAEWGDGGGIYCTNGSSLVIVNSILWDNYASIGPEIWVGDALSPSSIIISYTDVKGGVVSTFIDSGCSINWGPGMMYDDPLFVDPFNGDFHLALASPCIDSGDNRASSLPSLDFEGDPRIILGLAPGEGRMVSKKGSAPIPGVVDIGADEYLVLKKNGVK